MNVASLDVYIMFTSNIRFIYMTMYVFYNDDERHLSARIIKTFSVVFTSVVQRLFPSSTSSSVLCYKYVQ